VTSDLENLSAMSQLPDKFVGIIEIKGQNKRIHSRLIRFIIVVFSNGAMLSVSDKYDSVNERTQDISKLMKLHFRGVWQNAHEIN